MQNSTSDMTLIEAMPLLARNGGDWYGTYIHLDDAGQVLDRHKSHLIPRFEADSDRYTQTNIYTWNDGRQVEYEFTGVYRNGKVVYDTERIYGEAWETDDKTIILKFSYKDDPEKYIYEYIHLSDDGQHRTRVWHWFNGQGEVYKHTLIKESRTPD
ncbi:MAG: hypothetical protein RLP44_22780 [Aggregatilineales bacterium]